MQRRVFVIAYTDGHVDRLPLRPRVEMAFERTYKVGLAQAFAGAEAATNLYRIAWELTRAQGGVIPALDQWADSVDTVDVEMEDVRPTDAAAGATPSQPSPSLSESPPQT